MKKIDKYMMATIAIHKLGDISRDKPDICHVHEEYEDHYIGMWVTGYGFVGVKFPKKTTRELTAEEIKRYDGTYIQISDQPPIKLKISEEAPDDR